MPLFLIIPLLGLVAYFMLREKQTTQGDTAIMANIEKPPYEDTLPADLKIERDAFVKKTPYEDLFKDAASGDGLDWELLSAHAFVESSYNPKAKNPEGSSGLMQILLPLEKNRGARDHVRDGVLPEWEHIDVKRIFEPAYNIELGSALIRENMREFGFPRCVAVYNNSKDRTSNQGGPFLSQSYVDKVLKQYGKLKGRA